MSTTAPPIARALPILYASITYLRTSLAALTTKLLARPAAALLLPVPLFLYFLAPPLALLEGALEVFLYVPWGVAAYVLDVVRPVWVLVGAACICGTALGGAGRVLVWLLRMVLTPPVRREVQGSAVRNVRGAGSVSVPTRMRKRVL